MLDEREKLDEECTIDVGLDINGTHSMVNPKDVRAYCEQLISEIRTLRKEKYELKKMVEKLENEKKEKPRMDTSRGWSRYNH